MKDLGTLLRDGDPAVEDPGLTPVEVAAIRRRTLAAVTPEPVFGAVWQRPLAVAVMIALTLAGGILAGRHMRLAESAAAIADPVAAFEGERRQLQFATPGGTRIIWIFDSEFDLKETTP